MIISGHSSDINSGGVGNRTPYKVTDSAFRGTHTFPHPYVMAQSLSTGLKPTKSLEFINTTFYSFIRKHKLLEGLNPGCLLLMNMT